MSPPAWWCGLKYVVIIGRTIGTAVTTCVVVWIEIYTEECVIRQGIVTTCVVVWIEIIKQN